MGLLRKWGLGVELRFSGAQAIGELHRTGRAALTMKQQFEAAGRAVDRIRGGVGSVLTGMLPFVGAAGLAAGRASSLASDLEGAALTMRVLLGSQEKSDELLRRIHENAAATPFAEGDLIEGSKRLLRLSGENVDANMDLLQVMETMTALNPTKNIVDSVEALLDATSGGGFERLKEFGITLRADDFKAAGRAGGKEWSEAVIEEIRTRMKTATRGEDLVGALSQTFAGRMSTFKDTIDNLLLQIGKRLNSRIGFQLAGDFITGLQEPVLRAVDMLADGFDRLSAGAAPALSLIKGWWDSLGTDGQAKLIAGALAVVALAGALTAVAGVVTALSMVFGGLWGVLSGGWALLSALGGMVAGVGLGPIVAYGILAVGILSALFSALREDGESATDTLMRVGSGLMGFISGVLGYFWSIATALWTGFAEGFGSIPEAFAPISPILGRLIDNLSRLLTLLFTGEAASGPWETLGWIFGGLLRAGVDIAVTGVELLLTILDTVVGVIAPIIASIWEFGEALFGLVTGSMTVETAFGKMVHSVGGLIASLTTGVLGLILGLVEIVLRTIAGLIRSIPGAEALLGDGFTLGAESVAAARQALASQTMDAVAGVDRASVERDAAVVNYGTSDVSLDGAEFGVSLDVHVPVKVNDQEVARAEGSANVRAAQRSGRQTPAKQRGAVLRGSTGGVEFLSPAEVL